MLLCIEKALAQSGVDRADVNYVNAHATSTKAGDLQEYKALMKSFGGNPEVRESFKTGTFMSYRFALRHNVLCH